MHSLSESQYRINLAKNHLASAQDLLNLNKYATSSHHSQLCVENSCKAVIALFEIPPKLHELEDVLYRLSKELPQYKKEFSILCECTRRLGVKEHIMTNYGDELLRKTPWEIYTKERAEVALRIAEEAFAVAKEFVEKYEAG